MSAHQVPPRVAPPSSVLAAVLVLAWSTPGGGQQGYSREANRVVIDTPTHWQEWQSATAEVTDAGVRPGYIRKSTLLEVDGETVVVPGVNASLDAAAFGGGVRAAGSGEASAGALMDGRLDTWWEPDPDDPVRDWWVQLDLGRTVSATRIVLRFVDADLGDPFLHFKVTTSQGELNLGLPIYRTRYTTNTPVKGQRVFEIDLRAQSPTKWPVVYGDFTGDVINLVGIQATDSDFGKARQVSEAVWESLPPGQRGDVEYYRLDARGRERLLGGKEDWDSLEGTGRQGPVVHYRRERPRLAEVEVWSIGDNIGTGVLERGGTLTSVDDTGAEPAVVDGHFFGEQAHWSALGGFNPDQASVFQSQDLERQLLIDLGGAFFLDHIRVLQRNQGFGHVLGFPQYRIELSDGSRVAGGSLAWKTVGSAENLDNSHEPTSQTYNGFEFPLTKAKYFAFTYPLFAKPADSGTLSFGLSEIQFFGEGYMPEVEITSVFDGDLPFIELGSRARNLTTVEWDADLPPGTGLVLQTRTGDTVLESTHYLKKSGEPYPGTLEEAKKKWEEDKKFFGDNAVGAIVTEKLPGPDWSGWSQPYERSGDRITSPSPRRYVAIRAILLTDEPRAAPTLRSVALNFARPVARSLVAEVLPARLEEIGSRQAFSYILRSTFESDSRGFDEILLEGPPGLEMDLHRVVVEAGEEPALTWEAADERLEVLRDGSDSLWVRLPAAVEAGSGEARVELHFECVPYTYNSYFIGSVGHSGFAGSWQGVEDGDANGITDSETTIVLALQRGDVLGAVEISSPVVTPNGDGANDEVAARFTLMRISAPAPAAVEVYDLGGRLVKRLWDGPLAAGGHSVAWSGVDASGASVPPGIYLLRIAVDLDSGSGGSTRAYRLVHVAY